MMRWLWFRVWRHLPPSLRLRLWAVRPRIDLQAVAMFTTDQRAFRGYADDAAMGSATPKAAQNVGWTQGVDENFRIRIEMQETGGASGNFVPRLQYNLNGAGFINVTDVSSVVRASASPNVADDAATADLLTAGTGTFAAGAFDEVDGLTGTHTVAASGHTEAEWCVQILSADVVDTDSIVLRAIGKTNATTAFDTYTVAGPTITVSEAVATNLVIEDAAHAHSADNVVLELGATQLIIADAAHTHAADNLVLVQRVHYAWSDPDDGTTSGGATNLVIQEALHSHTADNLGLTQTHELAVQEAAHAHSADGLTLTQVHNLAVQDALHAHTADNAVLEEVAAGDLVIQDALHGHTADNVALTQVHSLVIQEALHGHTADNVVLVVGAVQLVINDALHAHAADGLALTQVHVLGIADASHAHLADSLTLTQLHQLVVQESLHGHTGDNVVLFVGALGAPVRDPQAKLIGIEAEVGLVGAEGKAVLVGTEGKAEVL